MEASRKEADWKVALARLLRERHLTPYRWIATNLKMGAPSYVQSLVCLNRKKKRIFIYNICDHEECYAEVSSQAISYTTGVPAMIGAQMILKGHWKEPGVWNMEQRDPDPFMEALNQRGLPWQVIDLPLEVV